MRDVMEQQDAMLLTMRNSAEEASTVKSVNAKISDSGYSNSCSNNSQSYTSSEALQNTISKRKDKAFKKKKKSKTSLLPCTHLEIDKSHLTSSFPPCPVINSYTEQATETCKLSLNKRTDQVAVIELVDATDPEVHNDNKSAPGNEADIASKPGPMDESSSQSEEYYVVISLKNGLVLHGSPSLYEDLGYQKDSWMGKLFTDLLCPKDKDTFAESAASEIAVTRDFCPSAGGNTRKASIFCRLRRSQSSTITANGNYQTSAGDDEYVPYRINLVVKNFHDDQLSLSQSHLTLLVVFFHSVRPVYKVPEETIIPTVFTTRHTASCCLSYVDSDVVQYLGYLPQDMIGRSLFDFYHPEDLTLIKEIYETVINVTSSFRSRPYRFITQNGNFVVLETEWSSFVNPWTQRLEFVIGHHRVLKGPADPNIFRTYDDPRKNQLANISPEAMKKAKLIQEEIRKLLVEGVQRKPIIDDTESKLYFKKQELSSLVDNILHDIKRLAPIKDQMAVDEKSFSAHDSVMLGEISPHHEYFDSKSSTETPPSYNQLNYHDNIERFFNSNIDSTINNRPYATDEENIYSSGNSSDDPGRNNKSRQEMKCASSTNGSGNSGSTENLSSESNNQQSLGSGGEMSNTTSNNSSTKGPFHFESPLLTKSLLNRHNEDMEKIMVQKHLDQKKGDKRNKSLLNDQKNISEQPTPRGDIGNNKRGNKLKRSGSQSRDDEKHLKILKYDDSENDPRNATCTTDTINKNFSATSTNNSPDKTKTNPSINALPPTSMAMPPSTTNAHQCFATSNTCSPATSRLPIFSQMFPIYYVPTSQSKENFHLTPTEQENSGSSHFNQGVPYCWLPVPYMRAAMPLMYPSIIGAPASAAMIYRPLIVSDTLPTGTSLDAMQHPQSTVPSTTVATMTMTTVTAVDSMDTKKHYSKEASLKDTFGSITTSSESSKKIFSFSGILSPCVSNETACFLGCSLNKSYDSCSNTERRRSTSSTKHYCKSMESRASQTSNAIGMVRKEPPWIEGIKMTPELIYQYQITPKSLESVLQSDLEFLKQSKQPNLVNDQLGQLFLDLELEGFDTQLILEEAGTNSGGGSSSEESQSPSRMGAW